MKKFLSLALAMVLSLSLAACTGGSTVIAPSNSSTSSSTGTTTATPSGSATNSGMTELVAALRSDGLLSDDGEYVFGGSRDDGIHNFISYTPSENKVSFLFGKEDPDAEIFSGLEYDLNDGTFGPALFSYEASAGGDYSCYATLNAATYNSDDPQLSFTGISGSLSTAENDLANAGFNLAMVCWNLTLLENAGMTMEDLGFTNF